MGRIVNVDAVIAGFKQMHLTKEFDYADNMTEMLPLLDCTWLLLKAMMFSRS